MIKLRMTAAFFIVCGLLLGQAPRACAADGSTDEDIRELTTVFGLFCVIAFPDQQQVDKLASDNHARPLPKADLMRYLREDEGQGWYLTTPVATYAITIEQPPYRTCAVRRMTSSGVKTLQPYLNFIAGNAANNHLAAPVMGEKHESKGPGGIDIVLYPETITPPGASDPSDQYLAILTNYHGHILADPLASGAARGSTGVEVRFARQILGLQ